MTGFSISELLGIMPLKAYFTLSEAANLKGINPKTLANRKELQPNGGVPTTIIGGKRVFSRDCVLQWIDESDADLVQKSKERRNG